MEVQRIIDSIHSKQLSNWLKPLGNQSVTKSNDIYVQVIVKALTEKDLSPSLPKGYGVSYNQTQTLYDVVSTSLRRKPASVQSAIVDYINRHENEVKAMVQEQFPSSGPRFINRMVTYLTDTSSHKALYQEEFGSQVGADTLKRLDEVRAQLVHKVFGLKINFFEVFVTESSFNGKLENPLTSKYEDVSPNLAISSLFSNIFSRNKMELNLLHGVLEKHDTNTSIYIQPVKI